MNRINDKLNSKNRVLLFNFALENGNNEQYREIVPSWIYRI